MSDVSPGLLRRWVLPIAGLTSLALVVFFGLYALDYLEARDTTDVMGVWRAYWELEAGPVSDAGGALSGIVAAILGIVITVVSIIVQLSASRYAGVTRMFLSDRVSRGVMAYYIVTCAAAVWMGPGVHDGLVPRSTVLGVLLMTTVGLALMAPYFGYVFWFLDPVHIVSRIRNGALRSVRRGAQENATFRCHRAQARVLDAMEELSDICSSSISGKDKIIASEAVDALKDFALEYVGSKATAVEQWFRVGPRIRSNPDFVAMDPESLAELEQRRTWVEWKVMRQYLGIYNEALSTMRDINYLIAIDTRYIGEAAIRAKDGELLALVLRFMNSYLRATLNLREVRTAYNVLNQYRMLVEEMLRAGLESQALQAVRQMRYYGTLGFDQKLPFVTETVAFDVSAICEFIAKLGLRSEGEFLDEFLKLDRPLEFAAQESGLLGVRKAQVKLACFYLLNGHEDNARRIANDMREEPRERLTAIRRQLSSVETKDFWEIIDRGRNFEFMPAPQRDQLGRFFAWLESSPATHVQAG